MQKTLIISTNNAHKLTEIKDIFKNLPIKVKAYTEIFREKIDVIEDGLTFSQNAVKKVQPFPDNPNHIYLADDSGLEVSALNGAPGIHSARYAGDNPTTEKLCAKLLSEMKEKKDRSAQFRTVIALRFPEKIETTEGIIKGTITHKYSGKEGFGYDPVFMPNGYTKTFAEMSSKEKNKISHRYLALQNAKSVIIKRLQK